MAPNDTPVELSVESAETLILPNGPEELSRTTNITSFGTFQSFTVFPKLPVELRLIIWKLALPQGPAGDGGRIFRLRICCPDGDGSDDLEDIHFKIGIRSSIIRRFIDDVCTERDNAFRMDREYKQDMKDLGLLRACQESRTVYLKRFCHSVPAAGSGKIYFNDSTILYLEVFNSDDFERYRVKLPCNKAESETVPELPSWFKDIKDVAVSARRGKEVSMILELFGHLKCLRIDVDGDTHEGDWVTRQELERIWMAAFKVPVPRTSLQRNIKETIPSVFRWQ